MESDKHSAVQAKVAQQSEAQSQLAQHQAEVAKIRELLQVDLASPTPNDPPPPAEPHAAATQIKPNLVRLRMLGFRV